MSTVVENKIEIMPVLALRGLVVFPGTVLSFDVARKKSVAAVKYAAEHGGLLYAAAQREVFVEDPKEEDLYPIGCVVRVRQVLKISDNTVKVLVDGLYRAKAGAV
ncbi:MAG TPA: endopeptidase La, partial [Ruminococcaceae bacterium]|nr:endopeptidase La [Oscillospiraceae bacterium]